MAKIKKKRRRGGSFFLSVIDAFTAFIYSLFANGRVGTWFSSDSLERESLIMRLSNKLPRLLKRNAVSETVDDVMKNSVFLKIPEAIRIFLSQLSLNVYGMFAIIYGASAVVTYFISILINGSYRGGEYALITAVIIVVCSFPMLVSSKSLATAVSGSRIMSKLVLSFFAIPEEKLKPGKRRGGVVHMFFAVGLALLFGAATYFIHPLYVPIAVACIAVISIISANPESGVAMTVAAAPFLQYTEYAELILNVMIVVTLLSYLSKVLKHRRVLAASAEGILVLIFCGFVLVAGAFSSGGDGAFLHSLFAVIIIIGGFFSAYCLIRGKRLLSSCVKIIAVSFSILAALGVWNVFYNGIVDGVYYSIREYVQPFFDGNNLYIADNASVFSVLALLSVPVIFAFMTKKSSVRKTVLYLALLTVIVGACFIYGTFETLVAILIEFCIFWVLYSHKTFNVAVFALIPIAFAAVLSPFILRYLDVQSISDAIEEHMPLVSPASSYLFEVAESTLAMLRENMLGIGAGESSFATAIVDYTDIVSKGATDPGSFFLQIFCWSGICGVAVFAIFAVILFKNSLGMLATEKDKSMRAEALALVCALLGVLIFGSVNSIWSDSRMLYLFWVCAGLLAGYVREARETDNLNAASRSSLEDNTDVELTFHK